MIKRFKKAFSFSSQQLFFLFSVFLILFFLLLDSKGIFSPVRKGISFLFEPVSASAGKIGVSVKDYTETILQISEFKKEFNDMKVEIYEKDINNAYYISLLEEKKALEKQLSVVTKDEKFLSAKVVGKEGISSFRINVGSKDGVRVGSVVSFGNMLVGIVEVVDEYGSLVALPYSKNSSFEAFITPVGVEGGVVSENVKVLSKAVIKGVGDHIQIENISVNAEIKEGDVVVVSDSKVGRYLVVGKITALSSNPAETSRSAVVIPSVEYSNLMTVFVSVE